jgi:hypothetical protein
LEAEAAVRLIDDTLREPHWTPGAEHGRVLVVIPFVVATVRIVDGPLELASCNTRNATTARPAAAPMRMPALPR